MCTVILVLCERKSSVIKWTNNIAACDGDPHRKAQRKYSKCYFNSLPVGSNLSFAMPRMEIVHYKNVTALQYRHLWMSNDLHLSSTGKNQKLISIHVSTTDTTWWTHEFIVTICTTDEVPGQNLPSNSDWQEPVETQQRQASASRWQAFSKL